MQEPHSYDIPREKIEQACDILTEENIDLWLTLVRETSESRDPVFPFVIDSDVVWESAFLIHKSGRTIALVGSLDAASVRERGLYHEVYGYDEDMAPLLRKILDELKPASIGINYSRWNNIADGLSHGLYLYLTEYLLKGTVYADRLLSADRVISKLRARKSPNELVRIKHAIAETEDILEKVCLHLKPGVTEKEIYKAIREELQSRGHDDAWSPAGNPGVDVGFGSHRGHGGPGDAVAKPGDILHVDFGARVDGYSADLQRVYFFRESGLCCSEALPPEVVKAFSTVRTAIMKSADVLKPGIEGWKVDAVAREYVVSQGYPEFPHALGHGLGRMAHDGGTLLGPRWPRYGDKPFCAVEEGNVFTLELGVRTSRGYLGLEEDVVVTRDGCEFLSKPQESFIVIG